MQHQNQLQQLLQGYGCHLKWLLVLSSCYVYLYSCTHAMVSHICDVGDIFLIVSGLNHYNNNVCGTCYVCLYLAGLQRGGFSESSSLPCKGTCLSPAAWHYTGQESNIGKLLRRGRGDLSVCGGYGSCEGGGVSGKKAALQVKQFDLYPSARNKGWAEVVDLHLLLTTKC